MEWCQCMCMWLRDRVYKHIIMQFAVSNSVKPPASAPQMYVSVQETQFIRGYTSFAQVLSKAV